MTKQILVDRAEGHLAQIEAGLKLAKAGYLALKVDRSDALDEGGPADDAKIAAATPLFEALGAEIRQALKAEKLFHAKFKSEFVDIPDGPVIFSNT